MIEELLSELTREARMQQAVAGNTLENGMHLFVYPLEHGVLIAIGIGAGGQSQGESLLRKRSKNMARFGAWLPAQFNDGSWYVVRRVMEMSEGAPILSEEEMMAAGELLT